MKCDGNKRIGIKFDLVSIFRRREEALQSFLRSSRYLRFQLSSQWLERGVHLGLHGTEHVWHHLQ